MLEQLNTYIISGNKIIQLHTIVLMVYLFMPQTLFPQDSIRVTEVKPTLGKPIFVDVWMYGAGKAVKNGNLWTANNGIYTNNFDTWATHLDMGLTTEMYFTQSRANTFRLKGSVGYKYERFAYDMGLFHKTGVETHWLSTDINAVYMMYSAGLHSDIFLDSKIKNFDNFTYEGLNRNCFNRITFAWYGGIDLRFSRVRFNFKFGTYIVPPINPNKVSYYNLTNTHVNGFYWEANIAYRIFSTKNYLTHDPFIDF